LTTIACFISLVCFILQMKWKKYCAFKRGLETSRNVGSLLLFFDYVGLPKRKKFCPFEQSLARNQTYTLTFHGRNLLHSARFFPPEDLVYFWLKTRHRSKAQTFFSKDNFPAKRLSFFFRHFLVSFKSAISLTKKHFPAKRLSFFFDFFPGRFKRSNFCYRRQNRSQKT